MGTGNFFLFLRYFLYLFFFLFLNAFQTVLLFARAATVTQQDHSPHTYRADSWFVVNRVGTLSSIFVGGVST